MRKDLVNAALVFTGLMLSPITWWNDPFVNMPISYLAASLLAFFYPKLYSAGFIFFYWLTNLLGIFLLYLGGKEIIKERESGRRQFITVLIYSSLIFLLLIFGFIRPLAW